MNQKCILTIKNANCILNLQLQTKNKVILTLSSADTSTAVFNLPELCISQFERGPHCIAAISPSLALHKEERFPHPNAVWLTNELGHG